MKEAVRRGFRTRKRVNITHKAGGRRTFQGQNKAPPAKRAPYPLAGRIIKAARRVMAPLLNEIEREEHMLSQNPQVAASAYQHAGIEMGEATDLSELPNGLGGPADAGEDVSANPELA